MNEPDIAGILARSAVRQIKLISADDTGGSPLGKRGRQKNPNRKPFDHVLHLIKRRLKRAQEKVERLEREIRDHKPL